MTIRKITHNIGDIYKPFFAVKTKEGLDHARKAKQRNIEQNKRRYMHVYKAFFERGGPEWYSVVTGCDIDIARIFWDIDYLYDRIKGAVFIEESAEEAQVSIGSKEFKKIQQQELLWAVRNKDLEVSPWKIRLAQIGLGTPQWADKDQMKAIYRHAKELTKATGTPYEVDHIVPLNHKRVCGLHNEFNLQVITKSANMAKGNRFYS